RRPKKRPRNWSRKRSLRRSKRRLKKLAEEKAAKEAEEKAAKEAEEKAAKEKKLAEEQKAKELDTSHHSADPEVTVVGHQLSGVNGSKSREISGLNAESPSAEFNGTEPVHRSLDPAVVATE
ncbi:hypothetical protein JCM33374_g6260, partial [Metschnikowia sp. JCM 33374]